MKQLPSQETLRGLFSYDPETGYLVWRKAPGFLNGSMRAGGRLKSGYRRIRASLDGAARQCFKEHRVIYKWMTGDEPPMIDHINGVRDDNRWCNLRAADAALNRRNTISRPKADFDLPTGVTRIGQRFRARYRGRYLGTYDTPEQAHQAYLEATCQA